MKQHKSGAFIVSTDDTSPGIYAKDGSLRVTVDDGGSGIYAKDGSIRLSDKTGVTSEVGIYDKSGAWNATFVDGSEFVGVTARNGSRNFYGYSSDSVITSLFNNGEQGTFYDPSDLTTLFQDAAGTTPVTADGDPVGLMLDKSGNGNHASQSTLASRPTYRTDGTLSWLEFDGVDDCLYLTDIGLTGDEQLTAMFGVYMGTSGSTCGLLGLGKSGVGTDYVGFSVVIRGSSSSPIYSPQVSAANALSASSLVSPPDSMPAETKHILTIDMSKTGRLDGTEFAFIGGDLPDFTGYQWTTNRLGCQFTYKDTKFLTGRLYEVILIDRPLTANELSQTERWLAAKTGVVL